MISMLHPNIQTLFLASLYNVYPFSMARLIYIYYQIPVTCEVQAETWNSCLIPIIFSSSFCIFVWTANATVLSILLLERIIAIILVDTYEKKYYHKELKALLVFPFLVAAFFANLYTFG
ncbi:unnamed protein product, partial [Mesorhabditis belari]|uniref:Uncharacterized protein n=1 Tax=Mesorhabditis belari TaxID=2138241 RepID=A0AAF3J769_9BILA